MQDPRPSVEEALLQGEVAHLPHHYQPDVEDHHHHQLEYSHHPHHPAGGPHPLHQQDEDFPHPQHQEVNIEEVWC